MLLISLILAGIIAGDVKTFEEKKSFAVALENGGSSELRDRVVDVPPWNSSAGWVGVTVEFPHQGKMGFNAYGVILSEDNDTEPAVLMRVVNESGVSFLRFDLFSEEAWNYTKVYAEAHLSRYQLYDTFTLTDAEDTDRFIFLFRGLKNGTELQPILMSVKESWYEGSSILQPTASNLFIVAVVASMGFYLVISNPGSSRDRESRRKKR